MSFVCWNLKHAGKARPPRTGMKATEEQVPTSQEWELGQDEKHEHGHKMLSSRGAAVWS